MKNNRYKGYSVRIEDSECVNIGEAKKKMDLEMKKKKIEYEKLKKEIEGWM